MAARVQGGPDRQSSPAGRATGTGTFCREGDWQWHLLQGGGTGTGTSCRGEGLALTLPTEVAAPSRISAGGDPLHKYPAILCFAKPNRVIGSSFPS